MLCVVKTILRLLMFAILHFPVLSIKKTMKFSKHFTPISYRFHQIPYLIYLIICTEFLIENISFSKISVKNKKKTVVL